MLSRFLCSPESNTESNPDEDKTDASVKRARGTPTDLRCRSSSGRRVSDIYMSKAALGTPSVHIGDHVVSPRSINWLPHGIADVRDINSFRRLTPGRTLRKICKPAVVGAGSVVPHPAGTQPSMVQHSSIDWRRHPVIPH
jgi:hypothetical protein